jgi:uncharacterized protein YceK
MKKQFVIIGIVAILITVGLCGCTNIGTTNIGDITANPQNYVNKTVTVEGTCNWMVTYEMIIDSAGHYFTFKYQTVLTGNYRLTGIIRNGQYAYGISGYYLDVQIAKAIS